jgi:hypothetical protein
MPLDNYTTDLGPKNIRESARKELGARRGSLPENLTGAS